jgi:molybdopterin-guanine dinucleotide biosynthesis protein A
LLTHSVEIVQAVSTRVYIVSATEIEKPPVPVITNELPGKGPMAGIQAALSHTETDWNLVLGVDSPLISPELLSFILEHQFEARHAIVPEIGGRLQPLCAVYRRELLPELTRALGRDELSIQRLLELLSTGMMDTKQIHKITQQEFTAQGFSPEMFSNVNTPEDLERVRRTAASLHVNHCS